MVKKRRKVLSKYEKKYGYTIEKMARITGWSIGLVHLYLQDNKKRKELLAEIKRVTKGGDL